MPTRVSKSESLNTPNDGALRTWRAAAQYCGREANKCEKAAKTASLLDQKVLLAQRDAYLSACLWMQGGPERASGKKRGLGKK